MLSKVLNKKEAFLDYKNIDLMIDAKIRFWPINFEFFFMFRFRLEKGRRVMVDGYGDK